MQFVHFDVIDDQGNRERDIYVNPEHVRSVISMQPYGEKQRARLSFGADDNVLVAGSADEVRRKLQAGARSDAANEPLLRAVEAP